MTEELGSEINVLFTLDASAVNTEATRAVHEDVADDEPIPLTSAEGRCSCTARLDARTACEAGKEARLAISPDRLYLFDLDSGEAIATPEPAAAPAA